MSCGCINVLDEASGALRCEKKCERHIQDAWNAQSHDIEYYHSLIGCWRKGEKTSHMAELVEAVDPFPPVESLRSVLELGCGLSPYAADLKQLGYSYYGLDSSDVAVGEMRLRGFTAVRMDYEREVFFDVDVILAAHFLEHVKDARDVLKRMRDNLLHGGKLVLVLPDDMDLYNPEHYWFFKEESLCRMVRQAGFEILRSVTRSIVPKENFIYVLAQRKG